MQFQILIYRKYLYEHLDRFDEWSNFFWKILLNLNVYLQLLIYEKFKFIFVIFLILNNIFIGKSR